MCDWYCNVGSRKARRDSMVNHSEVYMAIVTLNTEQIVELVRQLEPEQKRAVLMLLAEDGSAKRQSRAELLEQRLRQLAAVRGLAWDALDDDQHEELIDDIVHESRA